MKQIPQSVRGLTFDELVSQAKASDANLSPATLDRMVQGFEARLKAEGGADAVQSADGTSGVAPTAARAGKLGAAGKTVLGGVGIAAVAAFIYSATVGVPAPAVSTTATEQTPEMGQAADGVAVANREAVVSEVAPSAAPAPAANAQSADTDSNASGTSPGRTPPLRPSRPARALAPHVAPAAAPEATPRPKVTPESATTADSKAALIAAPAAATATSAAPVKPAPALDASLAQLERAERELRGGNPSAALSTLALPVVPSLSSRAEALRAVALCQSGQTASGRRLGTQHLVRNPRSPYEQRLQRACGDL